MKKLRNKQGFTLIEVVVVMAIIAVLAVLVIGAITIARRTSTETANRSNAKTIQTSLEAFYAKNKFYPDIAADTTYAAATGSGGALSGYGTIPTTSCANGGGTLTSVKSTGTYTIVIMDYTCAATLNENITI